MPISIGGFLFSMVLAQREGITDSAQLSQAGILGAVLGFSPIGIIITAELVNQRAQNVTTVNPTPSVSGQFITATAGGQFSGTVATVSDPAATQPSQLGATIDWGDKSPTSPGTVSETNGTFTVSGSHAYSTAGSFTITISVTDTTTNQTATGSATAIVAAPPLSLSGQNITATAGVPFSGQVATVSDPAAAESSQLSATIDWGDSSTSAGTVSGANGAFTVSGSHTYSTAGNFTIIISVTDTTTGQTGTGSITAMVMADQVIVPAASSAVASPAKVRVPHVQGRTYAEAREALRSHNLQAKRKNEEGEKDRVIKQEPHAETLVDAQSTVTLYVGKGFEEVEEFAR